MMENLPFKSYLDHFNRNYKKNPSVIAVKDRNVSLTYSDLSGKVNRLANYLKKFGAGPGMLVGISMERSVEMIASLVAVHKVGAAYVPLDPTYPKDRIKYMITDSSINLILYDRANSINFSEINTINITEATTEIERESSNYPSQEIESYALAYIMYTSGSTGHPKGVMVTHSNLLHFVGLVPHVLDIRPSDTYLVSASITYALSVRQIFLPLSYGNTLVLASSSAIQDPHELFKLIKDEKITQIDFVPSHWRSCNVVLRTMPEEERDNLLNNSLRRIVTVGEPLLPDLPFEWMERFNHPAQIVNIFGQTETTGLITSYSVSKASLNSTGVVSIGKPIPETHVYILEFDSLTQVKSGEIGELCVCNGCVAKGYLNNRELTGEKFIPNPFEVNCGFLYRTGDFARYLPDGNIEYLGRKDQQVKIRGMRVELGEIESVILREASIKEAVVVTKSSSDYGNILVAFLMVENNSKLDLKAVRKSIKAALPPHMMPVSFKLLDDLPRTPNGKIDRKALMEYELCIDDMELREDVIYNESEIKLLRIWKKLLKRKSIRTTDNFFDDLGGDSLLAVLMFLEIEKELNINLAISNLYNAPTIEALARLLDNDTRKKEFHSLVTIKSSGTAHPLYIVHGAGGNVLIYRDLSKYLAKDIPIFGFQSYGLDNTTSPLTCIKDMATAYIQELKKIQFSGPYYLCGYCMGGTIALEMAQQLKRNGDKVAFLGLLETYNWFQLPHRSIYDKIKFLLEKVIYHWKNFSMLSSVEKKSFLKTKFNDLRKRTKIWIGRFISTINKNKNSQYNSLMRQSAIWKLNDQACFNYKAEFYDGKLTVILPKQRYSVHNVSEAMWNNSHVKEIDLVILPFYPAGMLVEPFVKELAHKINHRIQN